MDNPDEKLNKWKDKRKISAIIENLSEGSSLHTDRDLDTAVKRVMTEEKMHQQETLSLPRSPMPLAMDGHPRHA